jgi:FkbM family methyltransferase
MKVFLDVGANTGQTLQSIIEPRVGSKKVSSRYGFDKIYCFEPVAELYQGLVEKYSDALVDIYPMGLWKENCELPIFSPGTQGGSIFADKVNVDPKHSKTCKFVRASEWFRDHLTEKDEVYIKINCEGCEADIIEDLLDSDEYRKVTALCVAFDVRKIPSQVHREDEIKSRLKDRGYDNYTDLDAVYDGSHPRAMQKWLTMVGADRT